MAALVMTLLVASAALGQLLEQVAEPPRSTPVEEEDIRWVSSPHTSLCDRAREYVDDALTGEERETLEREGALYRKQRLILSLPPTVGKAARGAPLDCDMQISLAGYLERRLQDSPEAEDAKFAAANSRLIIVTATYLWHSGAFARAQHNPHGRYNLLADSNLEPAHVAELASWLLREEGFTPDLVWALLQRPLPQMRQALQERLHLSQQTHYVHDQIYALALLHHLGDRTALPALRRLRNSDQLSNFEREFLPQLIARLNTGRLLTFADLEPLELYNDR